MASSMPMLEAAGVSKSFFGNPVLRDVSISLLPGRIHALLGENGAGKSTLINLLSGSLQSDSGTIRLDGAAVGRWSPPLARRAGIAVVQQELSLTASLSIAENVGLGAYPLRHGIIDYAALEDRARAACARVGLDEPLATPVGELPLGRRQLVEIAKALYGKPRVLILDEPTSSLSSSEAGRLTTLLRELCTEGLAILYISHRLNEVMRLCDYVTVLKDGTRTADQPLLGLDADGLVRLMVGREPGDLFPKWTRPAEATAPIISVRGLSAGQCRNVDLDIAPGEVLGIGGLVGQGQEDVLLALYGAIPSVVAGASVGGAARLPRRVGEANKAGIVYVPADRKREGLHLIHPIVANLLLPTLARGSALRLRQRRAERSLAAKLAGQLGIKGRLDRPAQALSGGNQQKVALAKWMPHRPRVLLLNDPTRGVDVETKREIYALLRGFAAEGSAVVLLSSDTLELVHVADRVAVMREGRISGVLAHEALSEEAIVALAMGSVESRVA
jgi:ribose transport system ATP-binding protein